MDRDRSAPHMPPDWAPPEFDTPEDIARGNRRAAGTVIAMFCTGLAACIASFLILL
jgi:hypothetical protein